MPTLLQINITANWGSHGRIAEDIGRLAMADGWGSYIAYGRWANPSESNLIKIGNMWDERWHGIQSRLLDNHGLASKWETRKLLERIKEINPDIIHLHNIHGYYLNYPILFDFLAKYGKPVVWTLHDCWSFTGHCSHFMFTGCDKWKRRGQDCKEMREYPASFFIDRSARNYDLKKYYFSSLGNLTLISVSNWLENALKKSFLGEIPSICIHNGIDLSMFYRVEGAKNKLSVNESFVVLAVASKWTERKGLADIVKMSGCLDSRYMIIIVGLDDRYKLSSNIISVSRTNSIQELATYYSAADVFVNPTYEDNFPTTNLEALACGTPVVTYRTGGSPEAIDEKTGIVVDVGDVDGMADAIKQICSTWPKEETAAACRQRAVSCFNKNDRYREYLDLYHCLL